MKKAIFCIAGAILLLLATGSGVFIYHTRYEVITLDAVTSPDGEYTLRLSFVGEPDWPFGCAYGRITLEKDSRELSRTEIDLAADGCQICKENWSVAWQEDHAEVTLRASEQADEYWRIYFDGRTEQLPHVSTEYPPAAVS